MSQDGRFYDITRPVDERLPVWPGDEPFRATWTALRSAGAAANLSTITLSPHTGTHADAPFHVVDSGAGIGELPLNAFIGRALVVDVQGRPAIDRDFVDGVLRGHPGAERILFRTGAWAGTHQFPEEFAAFEPGAVESLRVAQVQLVGTDAPSVDPFDSAALSAHHALFRAGIAILENLLLDGVPEGEFELIALPLRLIGLDGSPVRAVLRPLQDSGSRTEGFTAEAQKTQREGGEL